MLKKNKNLMVLGGGANSLTPYNFRYNFIENKIYEVYLND